MVTKGKKLKSQVDRVSVIVRLDRPVADELQVVAKDMGMTRNQLIAKMATMGLQGGKALDESGFADSLVGAMSEAVSAAVVKDLARKGRLVHVDPGRAVFEDGSTVPVGRKRAVKKGKGRVGG